MYCTVSQYHTKRGSPCLLSGRSPSSGPWLFAPPGVPRDTDRKGPGLQRFIVLVVTQLHLDPLAPNLGNTMKKASPPGIFESKTSGSEALP